MLVYDSVDKIYLGIEFEEATRMKQYIMAPKLEKFVSISENLSSEWMNHPTICYYINMKA